MWRLHGASIFIDAEETTHFEASVEAHVEAPARRLHAPPYFEASVEAPVEAPVWRLHGASIFIDAIENDIFSSLRGDAHVEAPAWRLHAPPYSMML